MIAAADEERRGATVEGEGEVLSQEGVGTEGGGADRLVCFGRGEGAEGGALI